MRWAILGSYVLHAQLMNCSSHGDAELSIFALAFGSRSTGQEIGLPSYSHDAELCAPDRLHCLGVDHFFGLWITPGDWTTANERSGQSAPA